MLNKKLERKTDIDQIKLKITDFGTCSQKKYDFGKMGTPYYMAPEVLQLLYEP